MGRQDGGRRHRNLSPHGCFRVVWCVRSTNRSATAARSNINSIPLIRYAEVLLDWRRGAGRTGGAHRLRNGRSTVGALRNAAGITGLHPETAATTIDDYRAQLQAPASGCEPAPCCSKSAASGPSNSSPKACASTTCAAGSADR
ncbi:MAG: hypothetical protein ACLU9X_11420 [Alistipes shahii]